MRIAPHVCFLFLVNAILSHYVIFHHFLTDILMMLSHLFLILFLKGIYFLHDCASPWAYMGVSIMTLEISPIVTIIV